MGITNIGHSVKQLRQKFAQSTGLPLRDTLSAATIEAAMQAEGVGGRRCLLEPVVTVWAFLSQVLDSDRSCRKAFSRIWAYLSDRGAEGLALDPAAAADTGAYCKARQRLPERVVHRLYGQVADQLEEQVAPTRRFWGRRVFLVDGTTVMLPDTPANQAAYPQPSSQQPGCGFPLLKVVALFSLATGALKAAAHDVYSAYEPKLLQQLHPAVTAGDLLVGDRLYGTYRQIAAWVDRGVAVLFRLHQTRHTDFRQGKRLGKDDRLVVWTQPQQRPKGMSQEAYQQLPATLTVRLVRFAIPHKGFRTKHVTVVTTLLDPVVYRKEDLARLYGLRWQVELDLRHLKASMDMDMLRTKTPAMVRKELAIYFLAYNLIRTVMAQAAQRHSGDPLRLSFKGTLQHLNTFIPLLAVAARRQREAYYQTLLQLVAQERLPDRPHRIEPRLVKRRPKYTRWLQQPRAVWKQKLVA
jgi:hypothetical protein